MRRLLLAVLAAVAAGSCVGGPAPDLEIDMGRICDVIALEVRDPAVLPGWDVHALALERSDGERTWALATDGEGRLQLVESPGGAVHDFSAIGTVEELQLVPGAVEGQSWLLLDRPGEAQVWRMTEDGLQAGPPLVDFPAAGEWTRGLVFLEGAAHILSVPAEGDTATVEMVLSRLDDALAPATGWGLPLAQPCSNDGAPGPGCLPGLVRGAVRLELLGVTEGGSVRGAAALVALYTVRDPGQPGLSLEAALVSNVELRPSAEGEPPTVVRHDLPYWVTPEPVRVSPAFIAADDDALYWLAGTRSAMGGFDSAVDFLYRVARDDRAGGQIVATSSKQLGSHVLQVGGRVAFGQLAGAAWTIAPLDADGIGVELTGSLPTDPGTRVSPAGRGQFLVRSDTGSRRVAVACARE